VFLTAATIALILRRSLVARLGAGVVLGLAVLTRANFLVLAPLGALAILLPGDGDGGWARRAAGAALFAAGIGLVLLPVAWRNHLVSGEWVLTTAQAGQNFYTGNNPVNPYGAYGAVPFVRGNPHFEEADFHAEAERRTGRTLTAADVSRFWFAEAFQHMREQPGFAARAMLRKFALFWNDFEISDNQDQYLLERDSWVLRLPLPGFGVLVPFALVGIVARLRRQRDVRMLVGFVIVYCLSVVAFFIFSRYRIQVVPALLPLAAVGVVELAARLQASDWRRLATAAVVVVAAGAFSFQRIEIFSRHDPQVVEMQLRHLADVHARAGHRDEVITILQEAVARCPTRCRGALADLADAYVTNGRAGDGEEFFRRFTAQHPEHPDGQRLLARLRAAR
jgi:4-amino-4-deoxy-L-arabinose transferase-like glycosyltransferase